MPPPPVVSVRTERTQPAAVLQGGWGRGQVPRYAGQDATAPTRCETMPRLPGGMARQAWARSTSREATRGDAWGPRHAPSWRRARRSSVEACSRWSSRAPRAIWRHSSRRWTGWHGTACPYSSSPLRRSCTERRHDTRAPPRPVPTRRGGPQAATPVPATRQSAARLPQASRGPPQDAQPFSATRSLPPLPTGWAVQGVWARETAACGSRHLATRLAG
jgi:hypothetical protein